MSTAIRTNMRARDDVRRVQECNAAYQAQMVQVLEKIDLLKELIQGNAARQAQHPGHWGYVGDLEGVNQALSQLLDRE
jgi:hypothetical protein